MQVRRDLRSDRAGAGVDERECVAPVRHPECAVVMARGPNLSARVADPVEGDVPPRRRVREVDDPHPGIAVAPVTRRAEERGGRRVGDTDASGDVASFRRRPVLDGPGEHRVVGGRRSRARGHGHGRTARAGFRDRPSRRRPTSPQQRRIRWPTTRCELTRWLRFEPRAGGMPVNRPATDDVSASGAALLPVCCARSRRRASGGSSG